MPYHSFIDKGRTIDLLLSNPLFTSPQIQPDLCKYWVATYLLLSRVIPAEKKAHRKQSAKTLPFKKQPPDSQTFQLVDVSLKELTSGFACPWNPASSSEDT